MGSITLIVEEKCEFEADDREFERGYNKRTTVLAEARAGDVYLLHKSYCFACGKPKSAKVHKGDVTRTVEVADCVEEMYEKARKADESRNFDYAEEVTKRGWDALAFLPHVEKQDRIMRSTMSDEDVRQAEVNWNTALTWFGAVENGRWAKYWAPNLWFGGGDVIVFDPTHAATAKIAEDIDDALGPDSGNVVLDEAALAEAEAEDERENLTSGYLRSGVPMMADVEAVRLKMHELDDGHYDRDQEKLVTLAVQKVPHQFDEGFDQVDENDEDSAYLCVCKLPQEHQIHNG